MGKALLSHLIVLKTYTNVIQHAVEGVVFLHLLDKVQMLLLNFSATDIKDLNHTFTTFIWPHNRTQIMFKWLDSYIKLEEIYF